MYNAKRDGAHSGASSAIPSLGAIEGRITVLEVVAMTSLARLLKLGDKRDGHLLLSTIRKAMRAKCNEIHLCASDAESAISYAQELVDATFDSIEFSRSRSLADDLMIA
jgi:hypothetical protein